MVLKSMAAILLFTIQYVFNVFFLVYCIRLLLLVLFVVVVVSRETILMDLPQMLLIEDMK